MPASRPRRRRQRQPQGLRRRRTTSASRWMRATPPRPPKPSTQSPRLSRLRQSPMRRTSSCKQSGRIRLEGFAATVVPVWMTSVAPASLLPLQTSKASVLPAAGNATAAAARGASLSASSARKTPRTCATRPSTQALQRATAPAARATRVAALAEASGAAQVSRRSPVVLARSTKTLVRQTPKMQWQRVASAATGETPSRKTCAQLAWTSPRTSTVPPSPSAVLAAAIGAQVPGV
mmetsp:Transcript_139210/g.197133  ORF Transcript_139210/g.197133 Transcript_139210/m.197133 type:complete len:235 (-) Transcript_139210:410-1114(-)